MQYIAIFISAVVASFSVIAEAGLIPALQMQTSRPILWLIAILPLAGAVFASAVVENERRRKKVESIDREKELSERREQVQRLEERNERADAEKLYLIRTVNKLEGQLGSIAEILYARREADDEVLREQAERRARIKDEGGPQTRFALAPSRRSVPTIRFQTAITPEEKLAALVSPETKKQAVRTTDKAQRILEAVQEE